MVSSPGFASNPCDGALFRLAFAPAPSLKRLNQATQIDSSVHSSIGTPSSALRRTLTACRHRVSGSISLPSRGTFRLSLTVLVHYRSSAVFSLGVWSPQIPTGFLVSRGTQGHEQSLPSFVYRTITFYGGPFQAPSTRRKVCNSVTGLGACASRLTTPGWHRTQVH